jgi:HD-like signal output (HDOD) protein
MSQMPTLPEVYNELTKELEEEEPSIKAVAKIISKDMAMCAKVFKLVNSSFFGLCRKITTPEQAVTLLGISTIRSLILSVHIFSSFDVKQVPNLSLAKLWEHSILTANIARALATHEKLTKEEIDDTYISGLLHDVGILIIASRMSSKYNAIMTISKDEGVDISQVERRQFGTSHAEAGAYLMGLWGMRIEIVQNIAFHHSPIAFDASFTPLAALYLGNYFTEKLVPDALQAGAVELDMEYLKQINGLKKIKEWEDVAIKEIERIHTNNES